MRLSGCLGQREFGCVTVSDISRHPHFTSVLTTEAARAFWRCEVVGEGRQRERWQLEQWEDAIKWNLDWLRGGGLCLRVEERNHLLRKPSASPREYSGGRVAPARMIGLTRRRGDRGERNLRTIQELLGHEDITTTESYLHVAIGVNGLGVVSPLDQLVRGGSGK